MQYHDHPDRFEYRLTAKGRDRYPVVAALLSWGDRWAPAPDGPPVTLVHKQCGATIHPELVCPECGGPASARHIRAVVDRPTT